MKSQMLANITDSDEEKVKVLVLTMFFMVLMSGKKENKAGVF